MSVKLNIGVIFGGRSVEHEVSIVTGYQTMEALDRSRYIVTPIYIARDNVWYVGEGLQDIEFFRRDHPPIESLTSVYPSPDAATGKLNLIEARASALRKRRISQIDLVIPAMHGSFGEDGCLQGLLEMSGIPYAGSNVYASSVAMDKLLTKAVLQANNLPFLPYCSIFKDAWENDPLAAMEQVETRSDYPLMVKPARLGSSVGVKSAYSRDELENAVYFALRFGETCLTEKYIEDCTEVNCAVLDGDAPIPSVLEKPIRGEKILTFDEKYRGDQKGAKQKAGSKGMAGLKREIPAQIPSELADIIRDYAVRVFAAIGAGGVARIDFIIDGEDRVYLNEINSIPGSFAYYLWENMGRSFTELLDYMIERAMTIRKRNNRTTYSFEANLLSRGNRR